MPQHDQPSTGSTTTSVWIETAPLPERETLNGDVTADVCVVGAGIAGMTTAYLLAREGKHVIIIDDGPVGGGETCRTTAHLANAIDNRYTSIEGMHGEEGTRLAAESHTAAIAKVEEIVESEDIDCDFSRLDGYLFLSPGESIDMLIEECEAAHRAGLVDVELVDRAPIPTFDTGKCLRFPRQAQFHPMRYMRGLLTAFEARGGRLFSGTHATEVGKGFVKTKDGHTIRAKDVVAATNAPISSFITIHSKQAPYRTYVLGIRIPAGSVTSALFWDTLDPYHYVRTQKMPPGRDLSAEHDILIVGGEDHKTGEANDYQARYLRLEQWARERFKMAGEVEFCWSGQVMETNDGLGYIGRAPFEKEGLYVATGDSGMGMTHGTIAGLLITDLIMGRKNGWESLYDPSRKSLAGSAVLEYAKENLDVVRQYTRWIRSGDVKSPDEVKVGSGAVIRRGVRMVALYRDEAGNLHEKLAACPHLGCIVRWNDLEKSWDCPCHGSRFSAKGETLNGPALSNLKDSE